MSQSPKIAIILPDALQRTGLRSLLADYCSPVEISLFSSFDAFLPSETVFFDFYFTQPDIFIEYADFFLPKRTSVVCIINKCTREESHRHYGPDPQSHNNPILRSYDLTILRSSSPQEAIVAQLRQILKDAGRTSPPSVTGKELSAREQDVLRLIVSGLINKEIADKLYISLNTVLTHRKNITAKLGIKTVPGLTFYAITNGMINSD